MGELKAPIGDRSVHLCIDLQRLFTGEGPWPAPWMPRVAPVIHAIVARAPEQTVFTRFIPPGHERRFDLQIELADAARVLETWRP